MYIRKTVRRYKDKTYVNFLLVESVLSDKGPRQKVICSLGDLSPRPPEQWLALARKLQDALTAQLSLPGMAHEDPELQQLRHVLPVPTAAPMDVDSTTTSSPGDLVSVHIDRVTSDTPRPAGHIHVGLEFWKRLGLDDILKSLGFSPWLVSLTCAMTLNRLIHPAAEYAMPDWIRSTAMTDILGVDFSRLPDDPLYRNLDRLHPHRAAIESALAGREQSLFNLGNTINAATPATIGRTASSSSWDWSSVARDFHALTKSSRATPRIGRHSPRCSTCWRSAWAFPRAQRSSSTAGWPSRRTSRSCDGASCIMSWPLDKKSATASLPNSRRSMGSTK